MGKDKKDKAARKDVKAAKTNVAPAAAESAGFQLFKGKQSELDDVFSKGAALALPTPQASQPRVAFASTEAPASDQSKQSSNKRQKKAKAVEPIAVKEAKAPAPVEPEAGPSTLPDSDIDGRLSDEETDEETELVHEAATSTSKRKRKQAQKLPKYVPEGETSQDRDRRTVFVGNLPIEVTKSNPALSQLRAHLLTFAPTAKIESIRFRSIPFATPTDGVPDAADEDDKNKRAKREKMRAAAWREEQDKLESGDKREREEADKAKSFIDAKGKRKVAFIKKDFHSELDSCNAYVVFAHPHPDRSANVAPVLDPFEAALAVLKANGSEVLGRTIRVDKLRLPSAVALESATNNMTKRDAWLPTNTDPKKSLFVGGLDYAAKEQDVRVYFEELVKAERGSSTERYVTGVRIVRDGATQLGKGFGYVHFKDRESVEELLALDAAKFRFAKRPLRVQPCKTLPNSVKARPAEKTAKAPAPKPATMPKGNPKLGEALRDLSKEERKVYKSSDADRQARRLAKKKMKVGMDREKNTGAVKLDTGRSKDKHVKPKAKKSKGRSASAVSKMKGSRE